jgi:hypothetical protein
MIERVEVRRKRRGRRVFWRRVPVHDRELREANSVSSPASTLNPKTYREDLLFRLYAPDADGKAGRQSLGVRMMPCAAAARIRRQVARIHSPVPSRVGRGHGQRERRERRVRCAHGGRGGPGEAKGASKGRGRSRAAEAKVYMSAAKAA